jgi:hypothetical protein
MRKPQQIRVLPHRLFIVSVALLAVLLVSVTLGSVWHHHTGSSEATCQICHLNHQPLVQWPDADRTPSLAQAGRTPDLPDSRFAPHIIVPRVPARAPPAV